MNEWKHYHTTRCRWEPELGWSCSNSPEEKHIFKLESEIKILRDQIQSLLTYKTLAEEIATVYREPEKLTDWVYLSWLSRFDIAESNYESTIQNH